MNDAKLIFVLTCINFCIFSSAYVPKLLYWCFSAVFAGIKETLELFQ